MNKKSTTQKLTETVKLKIRNDFVQGVSDDEGLKNFPTLEELHKEYKVAKSTLYRVANKEQWKVEREQLQIQYKEKIDKQRTNALVKEGKTLDTRSIGVAKTLMTTIEKAIVQNLQNIEECKNSLMPTQINALANAALTAQKIGKLALGETTENVEINGNVQNTAFREAMELLDTVAEQRRTSNDSSLH